MISYLSKYNFRTLVFLISFSVILTATQNSIYQFSARDKQPYNYYRIINDPKQVKPDKITLDNLFGWLNLKNLVRFKLWTRDNPVLAHEIKVGNLESVKTSHFDAQKLTKIIIHGYADSVTEAAVTFYLIHMRDAYLKLCDCNIILVDQTLFTLPWLYYTSLPDLAAKRLSELLQFLVDKIHLSLDSVHLVGFSLGAHVAGLTGKLLNGQLGRITGLDPAGPGFKFVGNEGRLDKSDAKFVDIIHTNGGASLYFGGYLGLIEPLGHADYFPNGGEKQAGCPQTNLLVYESLECSHGRAARYFIESIGSPLAFPSCRCENLGKFVRGECPCESGDISFMGEHMSFKMRGIYQSITKSTSPFGHGPKILIQLPNSTSSEIGNRISRDASISHSDENTTIFYKNQERKIKFRNTFNPQEYPNEDIINLCLKIYAEDGQNSKFLNINQVKSE